jgi:hypothetical protein
VPNNGIRPATYDDADPFGHEEGHQVNRLLH